MGNWVTIEVSYGCMEIWEVGVKNRQWIATEKVYNKVWFLSLMKYSPKYYLWTTFIRSLEVLVKTGG